jgi:hypothetical protein
VTTDRLQLSLIPDLRPCVQPLPPEVRAAAVALMARMLLRLVRQRLISDDVDHARAEVRDESR